MHEVKAVVLKAKNAPAIVETILVPDPSSSEALVDVLTCGVCHTDDHYQAGEAARISRSGSATGPLASLRPWARE